VKRGARRFIWGDGAGRRGQPQHLVVTPQGIKTNIR
jgi:hypothetical protein